MFVCCKFHLFRTRYVRYLMAFWCIYFHECFKAWFLEFKVGKFIDRMFVYNPSYSKCDTNEVVGFPSIILYGVN